MGIDTLVIDAAAETQGVQLYAGGSPAFSLRSTSGNFYLDAYGMEKVKISGGAGDDVIDTGAGGVVVAGGGGIDHWTANLASLTSGVSFRLGTTTAIASAGLTSITGIERITLTTGSGADSIAGGAEADNIATSGGNDTLDAKTRPVGGGIDVLDGGAGVDTLLVNAAAETLAVQLFAGGSPSFAVRSVSGNFYLDAYNTERAVFTGGAGADAISGLAGADVLNGSGGADTIDGGNGADTMGGGSGNDVLRGGRGADLLTGGSGADSFVYALAVESNAANGAIDSITDFTSGADLLDLAAIDANGYAFDGNQAFLLIGSAGFGGVRGELRSLAGTLEADINGDAVADFRILLTNGATALASDILL